MRVWNVKMEKIFQIEGMHCESCAKIIKMELEGKVNKILIDYKKGIAKIEFDEKIISEKQIKGVIENSGYKVK
ncbi:Heavy-metal-associated domain protein [uncultured archaeon]|nr:Heavy-metal-associated domain protein [uncultured archaeon]